jgi:hypothetical protein
LNGGIVRFSTRLPAALWVLVVSGLLGFRFGSVAFADWQVAVETAQVLAGIVTYPPENPFYIYHAKLWTILHQICALLLLGGVSEVTVSIVVSGAIGMITFQALSLAAYAISRDGFLAIGAALLVLFTRVAEFGVVYPIVLTGTSDTYGIVGLSASVLVAALFGSGCYRAAGFLLGLLPAIHLSLAVWFGFCLTLAVLMASARFRHAFRTALPYLAAGLALSLVSFVVHVTAGSAVAAAEPPDSAGYVSTFVALWDAHRRPVDPFSTGVLINVGVLAVSIVWLRWFARDLHPSALPMLWILATAGAVSLAFVLVSWIPPERMPAALLVLMPARLLNVNAMVAAPLLLGLIAAYRPAAWSIVLAALVGAGFVLNSRSLLSGPGPGAAAQEALPRLVPDPPRIVQTLTPEIQPDAAVVMVLAAVALIAGAAFGRRIRVADAIRSERGGSGPAKGWFGFTSDRVIRVIAFGVILWVGCWAWQIRVPRQNVFADRTTDPVMYMASQGDGLLLTGGNLHLVQLRTRRPVLLDGGGLDALPYAPEAAPQMIRILRDVYAIDFFNPPAEARGIGMVPNGANHDAWRAYSRDRWREIRRAYHVTQVLTYAQWTLDLPVAARSPSHVLYDIPE